MLKRYIPIAIMASLLSCGGPPAMATDLPGPAEIPIRAVCVPIDNIAALIGTNEPEKRPLLVDGDGDAWVILTNKATGVRVVGFLNTQIKGFCGVGFAKPDV